MENNNFVMVSLGDERSIDLANVLGNKTCKRIINFLAQVKSASAKDISDELGIGMSNLDYNLKNLVKSGLIEKKKDFFWSKKGKKIVMYGLSNKSVIISPKNSEVSSKLRSLFPAVLLMGVSTFAVYVFEKIKGTQRIIEDGIEMATPSVSNSFYEYGASNGLAKIASQEIANSTSYLWPWFLGGAVLTFIVFSILNWRKI